VRSVQAKRQDFIDGLRALAIIGVVGFHVGMPGFSGGFTGVDVFFVISGFLIGGQIFDRLRQKTFSLREFYAHRVLRILPPLFLMLALGSVVDFLLPLLPNQVRDINTSAAAAAVMISNQYFVVHSGYFDLTRGEQPYLHTWSLSVEEQFYLLAPIAMLLLVLAAIRWRRSLIAWSSGVACLAFLGSLALGIILAQKGGRFPFYGMPTRLWEFEAGILVMLANRGRLTAPRWFAGAGGTLGLATVVAGIAITEPAAAFPGWLSALPVGGAALMLWAGSAHPDSFVFRILALPPMVVVGLVSYSWYLWHWPVLFWIRTLSLGDWSILRDLLGAALALVPAGLTYVMLELPSRRLRHSHLSIPRLNAIFLCGGLSLLLVAAAILGSAETADRIWQGPKFDAFRMPEVSDYFDCSEPGAASSLCSTGSGSPQTVIWGDSHAVALWPGIRDLASAAGAKATLAWRADCLPLLEVDLRFQDCNQHNKNVINQLNRHDGQPFGGVVVVGYWYRFDTQEVLPLLDPTLDMLATTGLRILLVAPVSALPYSAPQCLYATAVLHESEAVCDAPRAPFESARAGILGVMRRKAAEYVNLRLIDPADVLCNERFCAAGRKGMPLYSDNNHLSPAAAGMVAARFKEDFQWSFGH
jgi:peptidoglycan/LPS O-acetylase OafA/YrhL